MERSWPFCADDSDVRSDRREDNSHFLRIRMGLFVRKVDTCIDISREITRLILAGKEIRTDSSRRRKGSKANGLEARQIKRKEKRV